MKSGGWRAAALLLGAAASITAISPLSAQQLTGEQIVAKCRKAYNALKSYTGTTQVKVKSTREGKITRFQTSANIQFVKPKKILVQGKTMRGQNFGYLAEGTTARNVSPARTWTKGKQNSGGRMALASTLPVDTMVASAGGVSLSAGTTIPSLLLKMKWGNPLVVAYRPEKKVTQEVVNGRPAYKVEMKGERSRAILWVDTKTFLLVKLFERRDLSKMVYTGPREMPTPQGVMEYTHTFTNVKIDTRAPASMFALAAGRVSQ